MKNDSKLKILIHSPTFYPSVGGLETVVQTLGEEFSNLGHQVKVICSTKNDNDNFSYEIIRSPSLTKFYRELIWCDLFFQNNISLKGVWPLFFLKRPWFTTHHGYYERSNGEIAWQDKLKLFLSKFTTSISISQAVADRLPGPSRIIGNPYKDDIFFLDPEVQRNQELIFVGRLVSDKGLDILIKALILLQAEGITPHLNIVGTGPEEERIRQMVKTNNLQSQVSFLGQKTGLDLSKIMNSHQTMVIPSLWKEPFGVIALEGIACGCFVIGSEGGGLKDAIGKCGKTFPNGDFKTLANLIKENLNFDATSLSAERIVHLENFKKRKVAETYLSFFRKNLTIP
ncbi:MAG: glycosyltransferase [Proteobacteria bacterium]|nr:glycosyltransferase [Pseudomonadota bacterium]